MATVLKTVMGASPSRVQISPPPPPCSSELRCPWLRLASFRPRSPTTYTLTRARGPPLNPQVPPHPNAGRKTTLRVTKRRRETRTRDERVFVLEPATLARRPLRLSWPKGGETTV